MAVRVDLNVSLDGVAAPADMSPENPMGADWGLLVEDYMATRTFRDADYTVTYEVAESGVVHVTFRAVRTPEGLPTCLTLRRPAAVRGARRRSASSWRGRCVTCGLIARPSRADPSVDDLGVLVAHPRKAGPPLRERLGRQPRPVVAFGVVRRGAALR